MIINSGKQTDAALKYYWTYHRDVLSHPSILRDKYHAIYKQGDKVYFHINSIVAFCQLMSPQLFCGLTASFMRRDFPNYERINTNGSSYTYRWITFEQFETIIHNETRDTAD